MPENENDRSVESTPEPETAPAASGAVPTSEGSKPPTGAQHTGFRFTPDDGVPSWAVGRTAKEVAELANQFYQQSLGGNTSYGVSANNVSPAPAQPPAPEMPTEDEWIQSPGLAAQKLAAYQQAQVMPQFGQFSTALGQMAREQVRLSYPNEFGRWGPEIDLMIQSVDPQYRNVDTITKIVKMVRADHVDELAEEAAKAKLDKLMESQGFRSDGSAPAPSAGGGNRLDFDKAELPPEYRRVLQRYNVTPETLDEFLTKTEVDKRGISLKQAREEWLKKAREGDVITEEALRIG